MKNRLLELAERLAQCRLAVFGDFLLDEYLFGEISRVSREAPVLILRYQHRDLRPGGGANSAMNAARLGATVRALGFVGDDETAQEILRLWPENVDRSYLFQDPALQTTRKTRILAGSFHSFRQQVVRLDYESPFSLGPEQESRLLAAMESVFPAVDALLISDYSLGNLGRGHRQKAIRIARERGIPVIVDSRDDPGGYPNATAVTPNISEVEKALGQNFGGSQERLESAGRRLLDEWKLNALLVTRGKLGMSLFDAGTATHLPAHGGDEPVDVTGAGDTVATVFALAVAAGGSFLEAARLANIAGGIVVMKKGTATVSQEELRIAIGGLL